MSHCASAAAFSSCMLLPYSYRKLKKLATAEQSDELPKNYFFVGKASAGGVSKLGGHSLKQLLTRESTAQQVVYERLFTKSLPQRMRESFFLTEVYNVKNLIKRSNLADEEVAFKLRTQNDDVSIKETLAPYYKLQPNDTTLVFESRFESGNLCLAAKVSEWEYNLFMQNDVNTEGHTQWFYFQVSNTKARSSVKFNIMNFVCCRCNSYRQKMTPCLTKACVYSSTPS